MLEAESPAAVLVVGDVNSTIACALVAAKKNIPVIHVEAGLRSFDRDMPEEINRVLTDQISTLHFITEPGARDNLLREGVAAEQIHFVGNVMIDTGKHSLEKAVPAVQTLAGIPGCEHVLDSDSGYGVLTLHRPSNVDDRGVLRSLLETVCSISDIGEIASSFEIAELERFACQHLCDDGRDNRAC